MSIRSKLQHVSESPTRPTPGQASRRFDVAELYQGLLAEPDAQPSEGAPLHEKLQRAYWWIVNKGIISPFYDIEYNRAPPQRFSFGDAKVQLTLPTDQSYSSYVLLPLLSLATRRRCLLRGGLALPFVPVLGTPACGPSPAEEALARGARALWGLQAPDGLFPSREFGLLGRGQSLTPFALLALSGVPERLVPFPKDAAARGLHALLALMDPQGAIGLADLVPDYPVYATALTVSALAVLDPSALKGPAAPLVTYLTGQQLSAGWEGSPGHGAFPMGGRDRPRPPQPGHVDLSMTRRAIEALQAAGQPVDAAAIGFVLRCGAPDGGFVYSPVEPTLNKSAETDGVYEGYGSATCDGILALLALGRSPDDARVQAALTRLQANHRADLNPNVAVEREMFARAMRFYYRAGAAQVFHRLGGPPGWRDGLITALLAEQGEDGLWRNELALQKESEPIIASSFALLALSAALAG